MRFALVTLLPLRTPFLVSRPCYQMSRRSHSTSPEPRAAKRPRLERPLTADDYKDGVMLAPMVRSGACA
jgi:hypothetical protein